MTIFITIMFMIALYAMWQTRFFGTGESCYYIPPEERKKGWIIRNLKLIQAAFSNKEKANKLNFSRPMAI